MITATNGARRITTHEAQIKTAAVEVKALTISGKQVTLSVFRQLVREDVIDPRTTELRGVPWGTINYFWKGCAQWDDENAGDTPSSSDTHLHVVWQKGQELRRDCVYADGARLPNTRPYLALLNTRHLAGLFLAHLVLRGVERQPGAVWQDIGKTLIIGGHSVHVDFAEPVWSMFKTSPGGESIAARERLEDYIAAHHLHGHYPSEAALEAALQAQLLRYEEDEARWHQQYDALSALDQLFIAV